MELKILTPEKEIYNGTADAVQLPSVDGKLEIRDKHAAIVVSLAKGTVKVKIGATKHDFAIKGGIAEVLNNKVSVLTEGEL